MSSRPAKRRRSADDEPDAAAALLRAVGDALAGEMAPTLSTRRLDTLDEADMLRLCAFEIHRTQEQFLHRLTHKLLIWRHYERGVCFVFYEGDEPAAVVALCAHGEPSVEIAFIAAAAPFQGRGYASRIVGTIAAAVAPTGTRLWVEAHYGNYASRELLRRCGFAARHESPGDTNLYTWTGAAPPEPAPAVRGAPALAVVGLCAHHDGGWLRARLRYEHPGLDVVAGTEPVPERVNALLLLPHTDQRDWIGAEIGLGHTRHPMDDFAAAHRRLLEYEGWARIFNSLDDLDAWIAGGCRRDPGDARANAIALDEVLS
jgi:GNAT superfamily N-acetyltransferase